MRILLCFLLLGVHTLFAQEFGHPLLYNYTPQQYDNTPQVFSSLQDAQGLMYFGLNGQVMQYDGQTWRSVIIPNKSSVYSLAQDGSGRIYVGATSDIGYLSTDAKGAISFNSIKHLIPEPFSKFSSAWQTVVHQEEAYFRTFEFIFKYSPVSNTVKAYKFSKEQRSFGGLLSDGKNIYVYRFDKGIYRIGPDSLDYVPHTEILADKEYYAGVSLGTDSIMIVTKNHGLFLFEPLKKDKPLSPFPIKDKAFLESNDVYFATKIPPHFMALGSIRKGVLIIDEKGQVVQRLHEEGNLQNSYIRHLYSPNHGQLWITMNRGFAKADASLDLTYWNGSNGLSDIVESVTRHNGIIYVGTHRGAYYFSENKIKPVANMPTGQTWELKTFWLDGKERLMAATTGGIYEIKDFIAYKVGSFNHTSNRLCQSSHFKNRIYSTKGKQLFFVTLENGQWRDSGAWENMQEDIRGMAEERDGTLWLGTFRNGLLKVNPSNRQEPPVHYGLESGLPSLKDVMPFKIQDGRVIFGTEYGLYAFNLKTQRFEPFCEFGEQFCDGSREIYSLISQENGRVFIAPIENKKADIGYLQPQPDGKYQWVFQPFRRVPHMLLRAFYAEPSGVVWMGGSEGLYRYDMGRDSRNYQEVLPTIIRKISIGYDSVIYWGGSSAHAVALSQALSYQNEAISFEFASPYFDEEGKTQYSTFLEGLDKAWGPWGSLHSREYTNLKEGEYTFMVKARNIYGVESQEAICTFAIEPPLYRTWWAYLGYLLASYLLVRVIVNLNLRRLRLEKERLEKLVTIRTEEIMLQKEEITQQAEYLQLANSEIHSQKEELEMQAESLKAANEEITRSFFTIKEKNEHITSSILYAQNIQQAVLPKSFSSGAVADCFVLYKPKDIVSGDFYWFSEQPELQYTFLAVIDCTGHGVPGAFMSMIGNILMNEVINQKHIFEPCHILDNLNQGIREALHQEDNNNRDGMDICLCRIRPEGDGKYELVFAGAKRQLYMAAQGALQEIKPTRQSIGGLHRMHLPFEQEHIKIDSGSMLYLSSDGFSDQGNSKGHRFSNAKLASLLQSVQEFSCQVQHDAIDEALMGHQQNSEQRDDITLMGVRLA